MSDAIRSSFPNAEPASIPPNNQSAASPALPSQGLDFGPLFSNLSPAASLGGLPGAAPLPQFDLDLPPADDTGLGGLCDASDHAANDEMEVEEPPYLPPVPMEVDLQDLPVDLLGMQPVADVDTLMNTEGKWRGRRPKGDWRARAAATNFDDPKSVNANFPPFKDTTKYGQLQVPQPLLDQFGQTRNKVSAVMSWRRMTSNQQRQLKAQFTAEAAEQRNLERYLSAEDAKLYHAEQAEQDKWSEQLREASRWMKKLKTAQSAYHTAQASGNTDTILKSIHSIDNLMETYLRKQLRAEEKLMQQSEKAERQALRAANRAAREEEDQENQVVSYLHSSCSASSALSYS